MAAKAKDKKSEKAGKIFVLDTSVILYNHNAFLSFEENDVAIPITVLEELDNFKKGNDTKNFEAREFIRYMDKISGKSAMTNWRRINGPDKGRFRVVMNENSKRDARKVFGDSKPDHRILNAALKLKEDHPEKKVILVSKDINLRLKAKSLNLNAEDFETGKIQNIDELMITYCIRLNGYNIFHKIDQVTIIYSTIYIKVTVRDLFKYNKISTEL